ncbi:MAG TPA: DUF2652 domain-containing protein [Chryseolinea sp.]|nr:DUF2652 domain-containing protein [Chryseolinea sp.]
MQNRGLLFIPDISGFTQFVNEVEIEHSRFIIQQLLEILINANDLGLEISEIEGDAILFYKFGEPQKLESLYQQVEKMFLAFHGYVIAYDHRKICQCKACVSAIDLSLKIITHYGEFTPLNVQKFNKLIGKDVIVAHQLLKNDIAQHEYWLVTKNVLQGKEPAQLAQWMHWGSSTKQTGSGDIPFLYTQLGPLKNKIPLPSTYEETGNKVKMLSASRDYEIDVKTLCYTVVHFEFRHLWYGGIKAIDEVEHFLPGIGSSHRHLLENGKIEMMYISSFSYDPEGKTIFSETNQKNKSSIYFIAEKTGERSSKLTLEIYFQPNIIKQALFNRLEKKKKEQELRLSLQRLDKVLNEMVVPLEF